MCSTIDAKIAIIPRKPNKSLSNTVWVVIECYRSPWNILHGIVSVHASKIKAINAIQTLQIVMEKFIGSKTKQRDFLNMNCRIVLK